jgi:1,4-alpha-glucan branching enzyme
MVTFHVLTEISPAVLHVFRDRADSASSQLAHDVPAAGVDAHGFQLFRANLHHRIHERAHALLHDGHWQTKEKDEHIRSLPRTADYRFPRELWLVQGANRVLEQDPFELSLDSVTVHLVTARRYRGGRLYYWSPGREGRFETAAGETAAGPYFVIPLRERDRHLFLFKFVSADGKFEPDYANRLWVAADGSEIWVRSQSTSLETEEPRRQSLIIRYFDFGAPGLPTLHLWQEDSDFVVDVPGERDARGWAHFELSIYTACHYRFLFRNPELEPEWEHNEARRTVFVRAASEAWTLDGDGRARKLGEHGLWTLEGDHEVYGSEPVRNQRVLVEIGARDPACGIESATGVDVWVNRSRRLLYQDLAPVADGVFAFDTYGQVVTSFRFRGGDVSERLERHFVKLATGEAETHHRYVVLGRGDTLSYAPASDLFEDPPFALERPGAWIAGDAVRFVVHCPTAASVEVVGAWTDWEARPVALRSTPDGAYFWGEIPIAEITAPLGLSSVHGVLYKLRLNQLGQVQDPAADWVESSDPDSASRLVDHRQYQWQSNAWQRPGWEYLILYQLHPSRFARRGAERGLDAITRELTADEGYLRTVGATALLLMPTCEFAGDKGWGYNPSFFYSVESSYGGPDALKRLIDACHQRGMAVFLDVVFNHAGASDNVLWSVARDSYFDGDTEWGAMINFDHPQVNHFFEQNLIHFLKNYRVDGFRFDFTRVIRYGGSFSDYVRQPGSGGGWEFMHRLRRAVHAVDARCLLMAENLPNEWDLTRYGGPMDSQWCDAFHDRIVDASRGWAVLGELAQAMRTTHLYCDEWYEATNYAESHDEVGNEPNRIAHVAGVGQGYRRNKVAAAATLLSRGIPMWFMGAEAGEWRQFSKDGEEPLDLTHYERDDSAVRLRRWWNELCRLRRGNSRLQGPAPLNVHFVDQGMVALSRGEGSDLFALLNFGGWSGWRSLSELNLPDGDYKELLNSTWGDYRIHAEAEDEHSNGGWDAHLNRNEWLHVPDYGVVVLERR